MLGLVINSFPSKPLCNVHSSAYDVLSVLVPAMIGFPDALSNHRTETVAHQIFSKHSRIKLIDRRQVQLRQGTFAGGKYHSSSEYVS